MTKKSKIELLLADADKWDSGELGRDDTHAKLAHPKHLKAVDKALSMTSEKEFFRRGREFAKLADSGFIQTKKSK